MCAVFNTMQLCGIDACALSRAKNRLVGFPVLNIRLTKSFYICTHAWSTSSEVMINQIEHVVTETGHIIRIKDTRIRQVGNETLYEHRLNAATMGQFVFCIFLTFCNYFIKSSEGRN